MKLPSQVIADAVLAEPLETRGAYLRELLAYAAAGLVAIEGRRPAAEAVYRVADGVLEAGK